MNKEYVCIGKIVNTHGIHGELRILSQFEKKDRVFKKGITFYIGKDKIPEVVTQYRPHKEFDMVIFQNYTNINEVLKYKNQLVYVSREDLNLKKDEYLYTDLLGANIFWNEELVGVGSEIVGNNGNVLLLVKGKKNFYIPLHGPFIKTVDYQNKKVVVENIEGLMI